MGKDDARWLKFGYTVPATPATPGQPQNLAAHMDGTGAIVVTCDPLALALRFRWRMKIVGVQSDYVLAARSVDPMASIPGVAPGTLVELIVQGVNGSLQGVASEPLRFMVPVVNAAVPKATTSEGPALELPGTPAYRNGNGNGNGYANGNGHSHARV